MTPDEPVKGPSIDERLALLERIEQREASAVRRAATVAWVSLAVATALVALLVFGGWRQVNRLRMDASALEARQAELVKSIEDDKSALAQLESEIEQKQAALSTMISAYREASPQARNSFETALDADPRSIVLVPRVYVHIVDEADRQWARNLSDRLQNAGIIPVGIEHVPRAATLRRFEVRYYKKAEEAGARKIVDALAEVGVPAALVYLNLETSTRVRANHYELWCPQDASRFKLPPVAERGT